MDRNSVVVSAATAYGEQDGVRFKLACQFVENGVRNGYHVLIVDRSPEAAVAKALQARGAAVVCSKASTYPAQKREVAVWARVIATTKGARFVFLSEPEKADIVDEIPTLIMPLVLGRADIVIPSRSPESWESYPDFQRQSELVILAVYRAVTGIDADPVFGPVAYTPQVSSFFEAADAGRYNSPNNPYLYALAPVEAKAYGYRVMKVETDFRYPEVQKREEEEILFSQMVAKRLMQQKMQIETFITAARKLGLTKFPEE